MKITLKDGSVKEYENNMSVIDIAKDISEGLARVACAGEVDGEVVDLRTVIDKDCELNILTFDSDEGKHAFRHTASHILAQAVKRLYPETKLAIGPSIDNGFYYDMEKDTPFTQEDLEKIAALMLDEYKPGLAAHGITLHYTQPALADIVAESSTKYGARALRRVRVGWIARCDGHAAILGIGRHQEQVTLAHAGKQARHHQRGKICVPL